MSRDIEVNIFPQPSVYDVLKCLFVVVHISDSTMVNTVSA
jgi:hypothetical protein